MEYGEHKKIVGFLFVYVHDETPSLDYDGVTDSLFNLVVWVGRSAYMLRKNIVNPMLFAC
ncbi:hypothetical protein CWATWH0402_1826 [Crocosphaera watsonii WH 0402]|uniref:Uncharacterized protein n=1 Tax=Crocosphaera watsonii WH 0402 TaxID=1284629 RepID=T2JG55_CROWT|nr:hypothetical protein CWATWH0402_1826 [Crocosphaera watsonii WH 0402]